MLLVLGDTMAALGLFDGTRSSPHRHRLRGPPWRVGRAPAAAATVGAQIREQRTLPYHIPQRRDGSAELPSKLQNAATTRWEAALGTLTDSDVKGLLRERPDVMLSGASSIAGLTQMVIDPESAGIFYDRVDMATRQLLEVLCVLGPTVSSERLASTLRSPAEVVSPHLDRLRRAGMVLLDGDDVEVNPGLCEAVVCPCDLGPPAADLLERLTNTELVSIASLLGLSTTGAKPALVNRLAAGLSKLEIITAALNGAPKGTEKLLQTASMHWPVLELPSAVFSFRHRGEDPAGWCLQRGLVVSVDYTTAVMPREVGLALRGGRPLPSFDATPPEMATRAVDQESVDRQCAEAALALVADATALCEAWSTTPAKLLRSGGLGVREVRRLAKLLQRPEDQVAWMVELVAAAGLVDWDRAEEIAAPTAGYDEWGQLDAPRRWAALAQTWLYAPFDLSAAGTPGEDAKVIPPLLERSFDPDFTLQRLLVCQTLAEPVPGRSYDPAGVAPLVNWRMPSAWEDDRHPPSDIVGRLLVESAFVGVSAGGALSKFGRDLTAGQVDVATEALGSLAPPQVDRIILQADFTATAPGEATSQLRGELDLIADVESAGHATVWRITEVSLRRGFDAGRSATAILEFLATHATTEVPQPLAYLVEDLGRRYGQVRVGAATSYVRCDDPALLAEIGRSKKVAALRLRGLAPTVAVCSKPAAQVVSALREAGFMPCAESADGTVSVTRPPAHRIDRHASFGGPAGTALTDRQRALTMLGFEVDEFGFDDDEFDDDDDEFDDDDTGSLLEVLLGKGSHAASTRGGDDTQPDPAAIAGLLERAASASGELRFAEADLDEAVERLRRPASPTPGDSKVPPGPGPAGPDTAARRGNPGDSVGSAGPAPAGRRGATSGGSSRLFDIIMNPRGPSEQVEARPNHIARDPAGVESLLRNAYSCDWMVRISYINAEGRESEFNAEILDIKRGKVRLRYIDRHGGGELVIYRIQWARILTADEEELWL